MEQNNKPNPFNDDQLGAYLSKADLPTTPATDPEPPITDQETPITSDPPANSDPKPEPAQLTDDVFNEWLSKKTEGKFSKLEDIPIAELPDNSKDIYDILKEGDTDKLYDYLKQSREDYSKWDTASLLREKVKRENPNLSAQDVEDILINDYQLGYELSEEDKDNLTPAQIKEWERVNRSAELRAKRDAEIMRSQLEASKKEIVLPKIERIEPVVVADPNALTAEQIAEAQQMWESEVESNLPKHKEFVFEVAVGESGEKYSTTFKLEGEQEVAVKNDLKNNYEPGDEKLTFEQLAQRRAFKLYGPQIVSAAVKDAVAKAQETFVERELKRVNLVNPHKADDSQPNGKNIHQYLMSQ